MNTAKTREALERLADLCESSGMWPHTVSFAREALAEQPAQGLRAEQSAPSVPMPQNADHAAMMALIGEAWLREHAPERLKQPAPDASDAPDPCPACFKGGVCRTPTCGRLKLPVDHPYRTSRPAPEQPR